MRRVLLALALAAAPPGSAPAQEAPLDPAAFRAFAEGWTLRFEAEGRPFGAESYHPGDRVIWKPAGGECAAGVWTAVEGGICFFYDGMASCWRLWRDGQGVLARPLDRDEPLLRVVGRDRAPLACGGVPSV